MRKVEFELIPVLLYCQYFFHMAVTTIGLFLDLSVEGLIGCSSVTMGLAK